MKLPCSVAILGKGHELCQGGLLGYGLRQRLDMSQTESRPCWPWLSSEFGKTLTVIPLEPVVIAPQKLVENKGVPREVKESLKRGEKSTKKRKTFLQRREGEA